MRLTLRDTLVGNLSSLFFVLMILFIPWEAIRGDQFADLRNYAMRIFLLRDYGARYFIWEDSILGWLKFEFLWFQLLVYTSKLSVPPELFFKTITAISALLYHRFLRPYLGIGWSILILLNPITIDLLSSQIRSAFGFALFLTIVGSPIGARIGWMRHSLLLLLPFIHSGMIMVVMIYAASVTLARIEFIKPQLKTIAAVMGGLTIAVLIVAVLPSLAEATEDRRELGRYAAKSAAYVLYWLLWAGALAYSSNRFNCSRWEYFFALIVCIMGTLVEMAGLPGFRFIALAVPVIFATILLLKGAIRDGAIFVSVLYGILLFLYWVQ